MGWVFTHDGSLELPYQEYLSALIHEPSFDRTAGAGIVTKARLINKVGNRAVHDNNQLTTTDAMTSVRELFHVCYWLTHTYFPGASPVATMRFETDLVPATVMVPTESLDQLKSAHAQSSAQLAKQLAKNADLDAQLRQLRAEVAEAWDSGVCEVHGNAHRAGRHWRWIR